MPYERDQYTMEAAALAGWLFITILVGFTAAGGLLIAWAVRAMLGK